MKATIIGWNYEGANFRGLGSSTDETVLSITLVGEEKDICDFVLEEFSYGDDPYIKRLDRLCEGYSGNDFSNGDGCGGVLSITSTDSSYKADDCDEYLDTIIKDDPLLMIGEIQLPSSESLNQIVYRLK